MINDEVMPIAAFSTPHLLLKELEELVWQHDISFWDAALLYADQNKIEPEALATLINKNGNLKEKIAEDCENLNYLPKKTRIPGLG